MCFKIRFVICCIGLVISLQPLWAQPALVSGEPIPNGSPDGIGRFALPFYNGYNMGMADVDGDGVPDLFLQGNNFTGRGIYLSLFKGYHDDGTPIFGKLLRVTKPFPEKETNRGVIVQNREGQILGFWKFGKTIKWAEFDRETLTFGPLQKTEINVAIGFTDFGVVQLDDGNYHCFFGVRSKGKFGPGTPWPRVVSYTPEGFWPYDIAEIGIYGAVINDLKTTTTLEPYPLTEVNQTYYSFDGFTVFSHDDQAYLVSGTRLGNIHVYPYNTTKKVFEREEIGYAVDVDGRLLRNPGVHSYISYFHNGKDKRGLITVGEGGIYYYAFTGQRSGPDNLIFDSPVYVKQENPSLYGGSLVAPNLVDWDGDGVLDIVSGTSSGHIWFFKNIGTDEKPAFIDPVAIQAGGYDIHIQPGYREDIQGPGEARWGYTNPNVVDWNGDGLPDILLGDSRGKFTVYINEGTKQAPKLRTERPLYHKGLDVFGSWRVKPGVGKMGDRMAYIIMDQDDEFHLYWRADDYNLEDGGKLTIGDSITIKGSRLPAGAVGRATIEIVDWDGDGVEDLIVGTYGKQSIPEPKDGLPFHHSNSKAGVLFMRNSGTNEKPVFEYPKLLKFRGENLQYGGHSCTPATGYLGGGNTLNLVVGEEGGCYYFYERKDLEW